MSLLSQPKPMTDRDLEKLYDPRFMCSVMGIEYNFHTKIGRVLLRELDTCDMAGAISVFEAIDPKVQVIESFSGEKADTIYRRINKNEWQAELNGRVY